MKMLVFLESICTRKKTELSDEEFNLAQTYIDKVKIIVLQLNELRDNFSKEFSALAESASKTEEISERFRNPDSSRLKIFVIEGSDREIRLAVA